MDVVEEDAEIYFLDECCVKHAPTITRMWAPVGRPPAVLSPGGKEQLNITGAVNPRTGEVHSAFSGKLNATGFLRYLKRLLFRHEGRGKIYLVLDNARIHHAKLLKDFLDRMKHRLELIFLPPYSPDLNPAERLWKYLRRMITHNTFYETFEMFKDAVTQFLLKLKTGCAEVIMLCQFS